MEDEEDDDWVSFHSSPFSPPPITATRRSDSHHDSDVSIFPPINHEGLPITPPRAPLSYSPPTSPPPSPKPHFPTWVDLAFHIWNSKLKAFVARVGSGGLVWSFRFVVPFFVGFWFGVWRIRRPRCAGERVQLLKALIREKDQRIIQLLEQIAQMNKLLLARYRIPVIRTS